MKPKNVGVRKWPALIHLPPTGRETQKGKHTRGKCAATISWPPHTPKTLVFGVVETLEASPPDLLQGSRNREGKKKREQEERKKNTRKGKQTALEGTTPNRAPEKTPERPSEAAHKDDAESKLDCENNWPGYTKTKRRKTAGPRPCSFRTTPLTKQTQENKAKKKRKE